MHHSQVVINFNLMIYDRSSTTSKKPRMSVGATPKSVTEVGSATKTKTSAKKAAPAVSVTAKKRKIADLENDVSG